MLLKKLVLGLIASEVLEVQVMDQRIGIRKLYMLEGALDREWNFQVENVRAFSISDTRIGYLGSIGFVRSTG